MRWIVLACLLAPAARAQFITRSWLPWKTVETSRFLVHYPAELEPWATLVAGKMEGIDSAVSRIVGYSPPKRIQIVIDDPYGISNGSAWPFLDSPALIFWATPPDPRDDIGSYASWADMLSSHEFAHLAHLTRPSRNRFQSALWKLAPVDLGPIPQKAPRWVIEGYATYVEGIVTHSGRPHGTWRATYLRQWALEGRLPAYSQLDNYGGMYGGEFAYLAGSAFLEWLAHRNGDSSLVDLWRRMSARVDRTFDDAFAGVYGEGPALLYGRYVAELTSQAKQMESAVRAASPDSGRPIAHLIGETGDPAISTDGGKVAIMLPSPTRPAQVVIWKAIPEPDTTAARMARDLLRRDPEDVPPVRIFPPPKKPLASLPAVGSQPFQGPRFFRDGRLLVWRNAAVGDGSYRPDLFIWDPQRGTVRRVSRHANLREGDPAPDGKTAAALRCAAGTCDLVSVDLANGDARVLARGGDTRSFYRPRMSSDGSQILVAVHDSGFWRIALVDARGGAPRFLRPTDGANWFDASFADDSTIVATTDGSGIPTVVRFPISGGDAIPLTHVTGAAIAPEIDPADHSVWFLALHSRGWDVRAVPVRQPTPPMAATATPALTPIVFQGAPTAAPHPYSPQRKTIWVPGGVGGADGVTGTFALVNTDPIGRTELLVQGQTGWKRTWQGASASLTSRATRDPITISAFAVRQDAPPANPLLSTNVTGGLVMIDHIRRTETATGRMSVGATGGRFAAGATRANRAMGLASVGLGALSLKNGARNSAAFTVNGAFGLSDTSSVQRIVVAAALERSGAVLLPLSLSASAGRVWTNTPFEFFSVGGLPATVLHPAVLSQRIFQPRLAAGQSVGKEMMTYRAAIPFAGLQLFDWGARTTHGDGNERWTRVTGAEWSGSLPTVPTIGTPAGRLVIGAAVRSPAPSHELRGYFVLQLGDWAR